MPPKTRKTNLQKQENTKTLDDVCNKLDELITILTNNTNSFNEIKTTLANINNKFNNNIRKIKDSSLLEFSNNSLSKLSTVIKSCLASTISEPTFYINGCKIVNDSKLTKDFLTKALNNNEPNLLNKLKDIFGIHFNLIPPEKNSDFIKIINILANAKKEKTVQVDLNNYFANHPSKYLVMLDTHASTSNLPLPSVCGSSEGIYSLFQLSGKPNYLSFNAPITLELKNNGSNEKNKLNNEDLNVISQSLERVYCLIKTNHLFNYYVSFATSGNKAWLIVGSLKPKSNRDDFLENFLSVVYHIIPIEIKDILSIWITLSENSSIFFSKFFSSVKKALQDLSLPLAYCAIRYVALSGSPVFGISIARPKVLLKKGQNLPTFDVLHPDFTIKICNSKRMSHQSNSEIYFLKKLKRFSASRYVIKTLEINKKQEDKTTFFGIQDMQAVLGALEITIPSNIDLHENIKNICLNKNVSIEKSWLFEPSLNKSNSTIFSSILMYNGISFNQKYQRFNDFYDCIREALKCGICQGDPRTSNLMYFQIPKEAFGNLEQRKGFIIDYDNSVELDEKTNSCFISNISLPDGAIKDNLDKHAKIIYSNDNNPIGWEFDSLYQTAILYLSLNSGSQYSIEDKKKDSFFREQQIELDEEEEEEEEEVEASNSDDDATDSKSDDDNPDKPIIGKKRKKSVSVNLNLECK